MKKSVRKLMCLALVVLLVAGMAVPAMAASTTGTGIYQTISFKWSVTCGETTGTATISLTTGSATVEAVATNYLVNELNNITGTSEARKSGYSSATATADNIIVKILEGEKYQFPSEIEKTEGSFYVSSENVVPGVMDYPG